MLTLYILMRHLPRTMNTGKALAQVHHAGTSMTHLWQGDQDLIDWLAQTEDGFGTVITLEAVDTTDSLFNLNNLVSRAGDCDLVYGTVIDPTYPVDHEWTHELTTCGYILIDTAVVAGTPRGDLVQELKTKWRLHR